MKEFMFIYEDEHGGELKSDIVVCNSFIAALKIREAVFANSLINDLYYIRILEIDSQ